VELVFASARTRLTDSDSNRNQPMAHEQQCCLANSWQNVPASPGKKFGCWEKNPAPSNFDFFICMYLGFLQKLICEYVCGQRKKNSLIYLELLRIRTSNPFRPFPYKIGQNSAGDSYGRFTFYRPLLSYATEHSAS
jgi:hypothetical protein